MKTILIVLVGFLSLPAFADEAEMKKAIQSLQREVKELRAQVRELQRQPAATKKSRGLKEEDYANRNPSSSEGIVIEMDGSSPATDWGKEKVQSVMDQLKKLKSQMQEHQRIIQELEKETK